MVGNETRASIGGYLQLPGRHVPTQTCTLTVRTGKNYFYFGASLKTLWPGIPYAGLWFWMMSGNHHPLFSLHFLYTHDNKLLLSLAKNQTLFGN